MELRRELLIALKSSQLQLQDICRQSFSKQEATLESALDKWLALCRDAARSNHFDIPPSPPPPVLPSKWELGGPLPSLPTMQFTDVTISSDDTPVTPLVPPRDGSSVQSDLTWGLNASTSRGMGGSSEDLPPPVLDERDFRPSVHFEPPVEPLPRPSQRTVTTGSNITELNDIGIRDKERRHQARQAAKQIAQSTSPAADLMAARGYFPQIVPWFDATFEMAKRMTEVNTKDVAWSTKMRTSRHHVSQSSFLHDTQDWSWFRMMVRSWWFDSCVMVLIVVNSALVGLQVNYIATHGGQELEFYTIMQSALCIIFVIEVALRILGEKARFFFSPFDRGWNCFDLLLALCGLVEILLGRLIPTFNDNLQNLTALRAVRILRMVRFTRIIRIMKYFHELRLMVSSISNSMRALTWAMVIILAIMYMYAVIFTQATADSNSGRPSEVVAEATDEALTEDEGLIEYFGDIGSSIYTLFQVVTSGINWGDVAEPLKKLSPIYFFIFLLFTSFNFIAVMNVITAVFVQTALQNAARDTDAVIFGAIADHSAEIQQLQALFEEADAKDNGQISIVDFVDFTRDPRVEAYFRVIGINISEAIGFFRLLDIDDSGYVDMEEFVIGCMRIKGQAKGLDVATLMHELKRVTRIIHNEIVTLRTALLDHANDVDAQAKKRNHLRSDSQGSRQGSRHSGSIKFVGENHKNCTALTGGPRVSGS